MFVIAIPERCMSFPWSLGPRDFLCGVEFSMETTQDKIISVLRSAAPHSLTSTDIATKVGASRENVGSLLNKIALDPKGPIARERSYPARGFRYWYKKNADPSGGSAVHRDSASMR